MADTKLVIQELGLNAKDPMAGDFAYRLEETRQKRLEARKKRMSPPDSLGLPPLLEAARQKYFMVDEEFQAQCLYDRIYVHQIESFEEKEGETGLLVPTLARKDADLRSSNRGIIVAAGLKALDNLRGNGTDLGHVVRFIHSAPWKTDVAKLENLDVIRLIVLRDGDLLADETLGEMIRSGERKIRAVQQKDEETGAVRATHVVVGKDGEFALPTIPWMTDDY